MRGLLFSLLLLFSFTMCKKDDASFTIKGKITDGTYSTGLANATIKVYQLNSSSGENSLIQTITTDSNGDYSFTLDRDPFSYLTFEITKTNYFSLNETVYFSSLTTKEDNIRSYTTTGKAWAKIHLTSSSPFTDLDISKTNGKSDCAECCPSGFQSFNGIFDTTFYCINDANTIYSFVYLANSGATTGTKSETTPFGDTVLIELNI